MFEENPDYFLNRIVEKVKEERIKRGVSQLKLANILDFASPNNVAKIQTRKHNFSYNLVYFCKIAEAFVIEVKDLLPKK